MKCLFRIAPALLLSMTLTGVAAFADSGVQVAPDADDCAFQLPRGFRALVVADNLVVGDMFGTTSNQLRYLTVADNGAIYAKTQFGGLIALRSTKGDGRADDIEKFGTGGGTGIALWHGWLYESTTTGVYRYKMKPGQLVPSGEPETIISGLPPGKQHDAKNFVFSNDGQLYVEVGSPFNDFSDGDRKLGAKGLDATEFLQTHGGFWRFDPNRLNQTQADGYHYSTGHRHSVAAAWNPVSNALFMVMMGRDQLSVVAPQYYNDFDNAERVAEEMHVIHDGSNLGWPYTYYDPIAKARMVAPEFGGDNKKQAEPGKYDDPLIAFPGHWAPLQTAFYYKNQFPSKYYGGGFIAFHVSWNRAPLPQAGYRVEFVPYNDKGMPVGGYEDFATGFPEVKGEFTSPGAAKYRPCGLAVGPDGSLYVGDSEKGRIWRIIYTGDLTHKSTASAQLQAAAAPSKVLKDGSKGYRLYNQTCAICHIADGTGVPNMQPALAGSSVVAGDTATLIKVILKGPAAVLPSDRPKFANVMPPFAGWPDKDIADVANYVRRAFGAPAGKPIVASDVAALRDAPQ